MGNEESKLAADDSPSANTGTGASEITSTQTPQTMGTMKGLRVTQGREDEAASKWRKNSKRLCHLVPQGSSGADTGTLGGTLKNSGLTGLGSAPQQTTRTQSPQGNAVAGLDQQQVTKREVRNQILPPGTFRFIESNANYLFIQGVSTGISASIIGNGIWKGLHGVWMEPNRQEIVRRQWRTEIPEMVTFATSRVGIVTTEYQWDFNHLRKSYVAEACAPASLLGPATANPQASNPLEHGVEGTGGEGLRSELPPPTSAVRYDDVAVYLSSATCSTDICTSAAHTTPQRLVLPPSTQLASPLSPRLLTRHTKKATSARTRLFCNPTATPTLQTPVAWPRTQSASTLGLRPLTGHP